MATAAIGDKYTSTERYKRANKHLTGKQQRRNHRFVLNNSRINYI